MKNSTRILTLGMAVTMLGGTMAYANEAVVVNVADSAAAMEEVVDAVESASQFTYQTGTIVSVDETEDGNFDVMMDNETGGLRFLISGKTIVTDLATGGIILAEDLTVDTEVSVIFGKNAPMGMSLPAYMGQVNAVVANPTADNFSVGHFDADLINMDDMLALNIDENTNIQSVHGTRMILTAEDVKDKEALVFFGATTRSIPAQTTPSFILLLDTTTFAESDNYLDGPMADLARTDETELVPLRETATELGFSVVWQGKDMPILMENDEYTISIEIGSQNYLMNDEEMTASAPATLVDGVMFLDKEILG